MENPAFDVAALLAPPDILKSKCALCIQPHPDDNEIGMGGTVAVLAQAGCTVHYLTVTNGDQGNKNRTASPQETARVRRAEAIAAGTHLGAKEFHFLDHGDGTLDDVLGLSAQIARVIREVRPDAIFAPDPWLAYESHLDHAVTGLSLIHICAQHADGIGVHLQRLLGPRRKHHAACHHKAGAHARFGNVLVIFQLGSFKHHLQRLEAGAVGKDVYKRQPRARAHLGLRGLCAHVAGHGKP